MAEHSYKRPHYYLVVLAFIVVLTAMYVIGVTDIFNNNGIVATSTPTVTKIFGTLKYGDIGSATGTAAAFITQEPGGSGTFFYAIAFMKNGDKFVNTNPIFLGDRIAPQGIDIANGVASFNYCDRREGEPFTVQPSMCVTKDFSSIDGKLVEIAR